MLNAIGGPLSPADALTYMDKIAGFVKSNVPRYGQNANGESGTAASDASAIRKAILGDGTTSFPGLENDTFKTKIKTGMNAFVFNNRYDAAFARMFLQLIQPLDAIVSENLPTGWSMTGADNPHAFDNYITRVNGHGSVVTGTPAAGSTAVVTLATDSTGRMPEVSGTDRPYVVHTWVGSNGWQESLPSTEVQGAAITHADGGYTYTIASPATVPANVYKIRLYRSKYAAGAAATKYYVKEYDVTPGAAYPTMRLLENDEELIDIQPPSWLSCMPAAEFALAYALAYGNVQPSSTTPGINTDVLLNLTSTGMMSANNVLLVPSNAVLGLGNADQHGKFGLHTIGTGWAGGTILTTNNATGRSQGFAGSLGNGTGGLRARVTSTLGSAGTVTISYTYYAASTGWGSNQVDTLVSDSFTGTAVDQTANFDVPAGRIIRSLSVSSTTAGSGAFLIESDYPRTY